MKHTDEPLTLFLLDNNLDCPNEKSALRKLTEPESFPFLEYLFTRVLSSQTNQQQSRWKSDRSDLSSLLGVITDCRASFREKSQKFRIGFGVLLLVRKFVLDLGYKSVESEEDGRTILDVMSRGLRGRLARDWKYLGLVIKCAYSTHLETSED
jgi:origin recognition complex subunit 3